jgi:hypothetical protein
MFGAASIRLLADALLGRRRRAYREHAQTLAGLHEELAQEASAIAALAEQGPVKATEREIQQVLLDYLRALDRATMALLLILENLEAGESAYRDAGPDGRSGFSRDKRHYDQAISALERLGARMNRLFNRY